MLSLVYTTYTFLCAAFLDFGLIISLAPLARPFKPQHPRPFLALDKKHIPCYYCYPELNMRTPSFASLALAASALVAIVSANDLDPIIIKGSSKSIAYFVNSLNLLLISGSFLLQNSSTKVMALNCKVILIRLR